MPSKRPRTCSICHRPSIINLSQHLNGVHRISGQERKQLIQREMVGSQAMIMEPQLNHTESHIEKHISFFDMLQRGERLRLELTKNTTHRELKAILELCLNMNEGNLSLSPKNRTIYHCQIRWMLKYNKMLYKIVDSALKEWKRKFRIRRV